MANYQKIVYQIKLVLLGDSNVGKTSILKRYINKKLDNKIGATIGVDFETKYFIYKNKNYKIVLYDTAGQERFRSITQAYFKTGDGYFIVFDLTNEDSLKSVKEWIQSLREANDKCKIVILGNKDDLNNQIPNDVINENLKEYKNLFLKTSAVKNNNINLAFEKMIDLLENDENFSNNIKKEIIINKNGKKDNSNKKIGKKKIDMCC